MLNIKVGNLFNEMIETETNRYSQVKKKLSLLFYIKKRDIFKQLGSWTWYLSSKFTDQWY